MDKAERSLARLGVRRINSLVVQDDPVAVGFWEAVGYPKDPVVGRHVKTLAPTEVDHGP